MRIYDQDVFEEIFSGNTSHFEFSEHRVKPVRPKAEVDDVPQSLAPHERFLLSSPHSRLVEKYEGGLTGNYLTALMLFGRGTLVAEKFGDWSDGPAKSITSGLSEEAERAVGEAFAAYREAEQIVGAYPLAQQKEADRLRKEHREAKAAAKVKNGVGVEPYMNAATPEAVTHDARLDESVRKVIEATADIAARLDAAIVQEQMASKAWLNAMIRQLLQPAPAQSPAESAPVETDEFDYTVVATRAELIEAFGKPTGMDKSWFDNLTDSPKLMAARKFTGQGGRHGAEPLFCPYKVTQWLADPKRKKGKPLTDTTAWRLLKSQFPKVYNRYSIGDPNTV